MNFDLIPRDIIGDVQSAPQTFSSWDSCMHKSYCKWPAIAGIIIGSLILLSILFCLVQCLCCGVSCARMLCCCCKGGGRGARSSRNKDNYSQMPPTPYQGYQPSPAQMAWANAGPNTATFDSSKKIHEDSLPAMPSWDNARTHRVEDTSVPDQKHADDLEMGHLPSQQTGYASRSGYNQVPTGPMSPTSPRLSQQGYFNQSSHPYNSDLGAQRMGHSNSYNEFEQAPHSPAPTYQTNPPAAAASDRFMAGAASPSPYQYQNKPAHTPSYAPSTNPSTRYEQTDYNSTYHHPAESPPPMAGTQPPSFGGGSYNTADYGYVSPQAQRPPSLLQVGRKAVPGSNREV